MTLNSAGHPTVRGVVPCLWREGGPMSLAKTARAGPLMLETDTAATLCQTPRLPVTPEARGSSPLHRATREAGIPREADGVPASMFSGIGARARLPPRWRD